MQQNPQVGGAQGQHPPLPSYAEAIRTAPPPANLYYSQNVNVEDSYQPSAPVYNTPVQSLQPPYTGQSSWNPATVAPATIPYPPTYSNNAYPPYGPNSGDPAIPPTTIHIIRPISQQRGSSLCNGRRGVVLAVVLVIIILAAILRVTMHAYS